MKHLRTTDHRKLFDVMSDTKQAQAAMMTLRPGQSSSDEPENEHPRCEQWLYVIRGTGRAIAGKQRTIIRAGSLLLIEKNEPHQITCTGRSSLVTLNLYVPPAHDRKGEVLAAAQA